jgi:hypothetical protein
LFSDFVPNYGKWRCSDVFHRTRATQCMLTSTLQ